MLFRLLNSSATDDISFALPGHKFKVIAMDGNPVPTQASVDVLTMGVAERVDAVVEMNQPGVWILGSIDDEERMNGMGIVIEYAGQTGEPAWVKTAKVPWDYTPFGTQDTLPEPDGTFDLVFKKIPGNRVDFNRWTINEKSWPDTDPLHGCRRASATAWSSTIRRATRTRFTCTATILKSSRSAEKPRPESKKTSSTFRASATRKSISSRTIPARPCSIATCNCTWISDSWRW